MTKKEIDYHELIEKLKKGVPLLEGFGEIVIKFNDGNLVDFRVHPSIKVR